MIISTCVIYAFKTNWSSLENDGVIGNQYVTLKTANKTGEGMDNEVLILPCPYDLNNRVTRK